MDYKEDGEGPATEVCMGMRMGAEEHFPGSITKPKIGSGHPTSFLFYAFSIIIPAC